MLGGSKDGNNRDVKDIEIYCEDGKNEIGKVGGWWKYAGRKSRQKLKMIRKQFGERNEENNSGNRKGLKGNSWKWGRMRNG